MRLSQKVIITIFILSQSVLLRGQIDSLLRALSISTNNIEKIDLYIRLSELSPQKDTLKKTAYADSALLLSEKENIKEKIIEAKVYKAYILRIYKKYDKVLPYYTSAIEIAKQIEDIKELANLYYLIGTFYYKTNNFQKSVDFHKIALQISEGNNDTSGILKSKQAIAVMLWRMGKLKEAEPYYLASLKIARQLNDSTLMVNILNSTGAVYWGYGEFHAALLYFKEAEQMARALNNFSKTSLIKSNIGLIYTEWGELGKALKEFREALKIAKQEDFKYSIAYAYMNIGEVYLKTENYERARMYFDSALTNYQEKSQNIGMAYSYRSIANTYLFMKNYPQAIIYYNKSIEIARLINTNQHLATAFYGLAQTYFELNQLSKAQKYALKCLKISENQKYRDILKDIYFLLSNIAEKESKISAAFSYYKKASTLKDSLFNEKKLKQIAEMQAKYEIEKKERENAILKKDEQLKSIEIKAVKQKNRIQSIFLSIIIIILLIVVVLFLKLSQAHKKLLNAQKLLVDKTKRINSQKEELLNQSLKLKETNQLLSEKTEELAHKTKLLQKNIIEVEKAAKFKNKMFSIIGHDLRGPLGTIHSIITLALDKELTEESREQLLKSVKNSSISAFNLLENLLIWANNERGEIIYKPEKINLKSIVLNTYNLLFETARNKSIDIKINIDENDKVLADKNMLDTTIRNLLSNAIKFSYENTKIIITAKAKGEFIDIYIRDFGRGMDKEELKSVLDKDKYFSSFGTKQEKGTGIGLQLCFQFIKANKGIYRVISEKGKGTTFLFSLPKAAD